FWGNIFVIHFLLMFCLFQYDMILLDSKCMALGLRALCSQGKEQARALMNHCLGCH
ncbi:mCG145611, partial [Mus musculus]